MKAIVPNLNTTRLVVLLSILFITSFTVGILTDQFLFSAIPFLVILLLAIWRNQLDLIFLILLLAIPFSFELEVTNFLSTDFPDEGIMWVLTGLLTLYLIFRFQKIKEILRINHPILKIILISLAWLIICTIFSSNVLVSIKYCLSKYWYLSTFVILPLILIKHPEHLIRLANLFLISTLPIVIYSITKQIKFGLSFLQVNDTIGPFFRNHVTYSAFLACIIPILIIYSFKANEKWQRYLSLFLTLLCLLNIIFTYSRGAWLGLIMCIPFYFLLKKKLLAKFIRLLFPAIACCFVFIISTGSYQNFRSGKKETIHHKNIKSHLSATYNLTDMSFAERIHRWIAGVRMTRAKPISGFGPNTFSRNYKPYTLWQFETWVSANPEKSSVHNYYLLQFSEQGIFGGILFLMLIYFCFKSVESMYHRLKKYSLIALGIGFILTVISIELCVNDLIETDKIGSLFYLCIASIIFLNHYGKVIPNKEKVE